MTNAQRITLWFTFNQLLGARGQSEMLYAEFREFAQVFEDRLAMEEAAARMVRASWRSEMQA